MKGISKNSVLSDLKELLDSNREQIIEQNRMDLDHASSLDPVLVDRLKVDDVKVDGMIKSVGDVIDMPDPTGEVIYSFTHDNGIYVENKVVPFGRVLIIYESRPDVTIEAAISAFKAGNQILLKGGKEAKRSNLFLVELWHKALEKNGLNIDYVQYLDMNREETQALIRMNELNVDVIIPRGGDTLINFIQSNTSIPVIVSGRGNNFAYVHEDADYEMVRNIVLDGKKRLSVCNALDKVLFHRSVPWITQRMSELVKALKDQGIDVHARQAQFGSLALFEKVDGEDIYFEEFLGPRILFELVEDESAAIEMINKYSGGHTAVIITSDNSVASEFQDKVDCAAVIHNASSRFTDGGQFGLGAEIAISTQKLHFRGPVSLTQLVTNKWIVRGSGQVRN